MTDVGICGMVPGRRYRAVFEDCCVKGQFVDTFVELVPYVDGGTIEGPLDVERAVFEHAEIGGNAEITFEPAD